MLTSWKKKKLEFLERFPQHMPEGFCKDICICKDNSYTDSNQVILANTNKKQIYKASV